MQGHPDDRVGHAQSRVADRTTYGPAEDHPRDLADDDEHEDQEERHEQLRAWSVEVADDVRGEQDSGGRTEHHPDEGEQRSWRPGPPARNGGEERDGEDGYVEPL